MTTGTSATAGSCRRRGRWRSVRPAGGCAGLKTWFSRSLYTGGIDRHIARTRLRGRSRNADTTGSVGQAQLRAHGRSPPPHHRRAGSIPRSAAHNRILYFRLLANRRFFPSFLPVSLNSVSVVLRRIVTLRDSIHICSAVQRNRSYRSSNEIYTNILYSYCAQYSKL